MFVNTSPFHCRMWSPETVKYTSTLSPLGTGWSGSMYCPAFLRPGVLSIVLFQSFVESPLFWNTPSDFGSPPSSSMPR